MTAKVLDRIRDILLEAYEREAMGGAVEVHVGCHIMALMQKEINENYITLSRPLKGEKGFLTIEPDSNPFRSQRVSVTMWTPFGKAEVYPCRSMRRGCIVRDHLRGMYVCEDAFQELTE